VVVQVSIAPNRLVEMLREVTAAFGGRKVSHAVAGGMAVAAHGLLRATKDVDFLVDAADSLLADAAMRGLGFAAPLESAGGSFKRYVRHPLPELPELTEWVDLLLVRQEIGRDLLRRAAAAPLHWQGIDLPIVSLEGLLLMKVLAVVDNPSRHQDRGDIIGLLRLHPTRIDRSWIESAARNLGDLHAQTFNNLAAEADRIKGPSAHRLDL